MLCTVLLLLSCGPEQEADDTSNTQPILEKTVQTKEIATYTAIAKPTKNPTEIPTASVTTAAAETQILLNPTIANAIPIPVTVYNGSWVIEHSSGEMQINFDETVWESTQFDEFIPLYYEGGPALVNMEVDGCTLSLNVGGGVPMDWTLTAEEIFQGTHEFSKVSFYNGEGELQFVIYNQLFRITFGDDIETCIREAEVVIVNFQLRDND